MKKFEFLPHTAELRMRVWGSSLEELFRNALAGLAHVLGGDAVSGGAPRRAAASASITISANSSTNLLIDFLNEVLYLSNVNKAVYDRVEFSKFSEKELAGSLHSYDIRGFAEDVKAVTYHGAEIKRSEQGQFEVEIVFDI